MERRNSEEQILARYNENMRRNEEELLEIQGRKKTLEKHEDELEEVKWKLNHYFETHREFYVGTEEFSRFDTLESEIYECERSSRRQLNEEREEIKKEEKYLYEQQETCHAEYQSELRAFLEKEDN